MSAGRISGKQCPFLNNACMSEGYATFMGVWLGTALLDAVIGDATKSWDLRFP